MKKILAFLTSLLILCFIVVLLHEFLPKSSLVNNREFGGWCSMYKDMSARAIGQNMQEDSMLVMGSSEFDHGQDEFYHPGNFFKKTNFSPMIVGSAYNQSLNHTITLGALAPYAANNKAVLLLSMPWFYPKGVPPQKFAWRFSEGTFNTFLQNEDIPLKLRKKIAKRAIKLLKKGDPQMEYNAKVAYKVLMKKKSSRFERMYFNLRSVFIADRETVSVMTDMFRAGIKPQDKYKVYKKKIKKAEWRRVIKKASRESYDYNNKYNMDNKFWKYIYSRKEPLIKNAHRKKNFKKSPEFKDFIYFLKVCKATKIRPLIVMLPVNGKWYDVAGLKKKNRDRYQRKIRKICKKYKVKVIDFKKYDYKPNIIKDVVHIWKEGWLRVNEKIYKYYMQG